MALCRSAKAPCKEMVVFLPTVVGTLVPWLKLTGRVEATQPFGN